MQRLSGSGSFATDVDDFIPDNKILLLYCWCLLLKFM